MTVLELLNLATTPIAQSLELPGKSQVLLNEAILLAGTIVIALTIFWGVMRPLCSHWGENALATRLWQQLSLPTLVALGTFFLATVVKEEAANTFILSGTGILASLWLTARICWLLPVAEQIQRLILLGAFVVILLAAGNLLTPLLQLMDAARLPLGDDNYISLLSVGKAFFIFGVLAWGGLAMGVWVENSLSRHRFSPALQTLLVKIFKITVLILVGLITLNLVGINLASLAIFGGALGIGIGFGLRTVTSNFISGLLLLMDRSIKPGDVISVDDQTYGQVKAMNTRYIVMRRRDGMEVLIPNEQLMTNQVINWSFSNKAVRHDVEIGVAYGSDMEKVQKLLKETVKAVPRVLEVPGPNVFIKEFGESAVTFLVRIWSNDPEAGVANLKGAINMAIWKALQENGIEIPFPQRVVHLRK
jgi:small-conductance mechanosensitive channel